MKKHTMALGMLVVVSCVLLMISGCTEENLKPSAESLQTILEKATTINSVYYQLETSVTIIDSIEQSTEMRLWEKGPYLKQMENTTAGGITTSQTIIKRPEGIYRYDDERQIYELDPQPVILQPTIVETMQDLLQNQTLTTLGTEMIEGIPVTVIQYTPSGMGNGTTVTLWIWNAKGVPLRKRSVTKNEETMVTIDTKYMNYSFSEIPELVFNVQ